MDRHHRHKQKMRLGDRFAEWMSRRIGSTLSIFLHTCAFIACFEAWLLGEVELQTMLLWLTTIVSLEAIYIGLFLQNSSNRHGDANVHQAAEDFRVNQEAMAAIDQHFALTREHDERLRDIENLVSALGIAQTENFKLLHTILTKKSTPARRKPKVSRK